MTRNRPVQALAVIGALTLAFGAWVATGLGGELTTRAVDDLATVAAVAAAAWLCARAALRHEGRLRLHWWLLAAGCTAWAIGEVLWAVYDLVTGDVPKTSWADVAFLAALPPIAAALLVHPALRVRMIGRARALLDGLVLAAALFFAAGNLILEPVRQSTDLTSRAGVVTLAYPLSDVVIVFLVVLVIRETTRSARLDLWWLLSGVLLIAVSDSAYSYLTDVRSFSTGGVIDTGWFAGYLAIAVGAMCARSHAGAPLPANWSSRPTRAGILTPFLAIFGALVLLAARIETGHRLDNVSLAVAFAVVGLVLLRQVLLVIDLVAPVGHDGDLALGQQR